MSQPHQPQQRATESDHIRGRTERIVLPNEWHPKHWGGWEFYGGAPVPEDTVANFAARAVNLELFVRPDEEHEWTVQLTLDAEDGRSLLNPVSIAGTTGIGRSFWPDCVEDVQALLSQIGRYGYARPTPDGWVVYATVTAADARAMIATDTEMHMVQRASPGWVFLDTRAAVPLGGSLASTPGVMTPPAQHAAPAATFSAEPRTPAEPPPVQQDTDTADPPTTHQSIVAAYAATSTHGRIDQESVRVVRASPHPISREELDAALKRTGPGEGLHTILLSVPSKIDGYELIAYVTEQIKTEPPFDYYGKEAISGDLVIGGVAYNDEPYSPDVPGGILEKSSKTDGESHNTNTPNESTRSVTHQPIATNNTTSREASQVTSGERPGTPGSQHGGISPYGGTARRR